MKIIIDEPIYVNRAAICKYLGKGSKFLGSWCVKTKAGGWSEQPIDVFYNPIPPEPFTNSLVGYYNDYLGYLYVCDATSALEIKHMPCIVEDDIVYISKYRHDFVKTPKGCIVDGGRDYLRSNIVNLDTFLSFDIESGNFYLSSTKVHGHKLVTIEYEDVNVINK